jgi:hypothetical protein
LDLLIGYQGKALRLEDCDRLIRGRQILADSAGAREEAKQSWKALETIAEGTPN